MSRPGRKRKPGARYPSGDRKNTDTPQRPAALIKRMIAAAQQRAADPLLATQIGWLRLHDMITDREAAAGTQFATVVGQYERAIGLPARVARSPSYERGFGGGRSWNNAEGDARRVETARRRHASLVTQLEHAAPGRGSYRLLVKVCVDDVAPDWAERANLKAALGLCAEHFGLAV